MCTINYLANSSPNSMCLSGSPGVETCVIEIEDSDVVVGKLEQNGPNAYKYWEERITFLALRNHRQIT